MSTVRRIPVVKSMLGLVERVHLFLKYTEHSYMVLVAIAIGLLGGLGAVGFRECIRLFQAVAWQTDSVTLDYLRNLPIWWKVLAPAVGGLIVGLIIVRSGDRIVDLLPDADSVFQEGDVMLVLGNEDRISRFERNG